jgi:Tol biopolymer transport system component
MKYSTFPLFLVFVLLAGCGNFFKAHQPVIVMSTFDGDFSWGRLYAIHTDGSHASGIPGGLGDDPQWSKDGKWVVFSKDNFFEVNATQIILMRANGSHRIPLTDKKGDSRSPSWSPDGHAIAYEDSAKIYIVDVSCLIDGKSPKDCPISPRQITEEYSYSPDWDPSGNRILYNTHDAQPKEREIKVINADGAGPNETIFTPGLQYCRKPKWSPDGEEILVSCSEAVWGGGGMYRIRKDGTLLTSYLDLGISGDEPQWSPDGERIFFTSMMGEDLGEPVNMEGTVISNALYSMKPDGSDLLRLTSQSDEYIRWFALMP